MGAVYIRATKYATLVAQLVAVVLITQIALMLIPKFNNASKNDFTLHFNSPHLGAGENGVNVGVLPFCPLATSVHRLNGKMLFFLTWKSQVMIL
jgi:hypothetical protein